MNVALFIARRYFFSKKKRNIINIISIIAMIGVGVGSMALIVVLSVFNGLEDLIRSLYGKFDPEIKITSIEGKSFETNAQFLERIRKTPGVALLTEVIEDNALLRYNDRQMVVKVKGVSDNFFLQNQIDSAIVEGSYRLKKGKTQYALIGRGVQYQLSIRTENPFSPLQFLYPKAGKKTVINPENAFRQEGIQAGGVFAIERQYDDQYVFVPLTFAQELLSYGNKRTALEVKTEDPKDIDNVKAALQEQLGPGFNVQNSEEQHVSLLRAVKVEKLFVFVTFTFVLLIASINIFFSLSMLVLDKQKDIAILASLGADPGTIRKVFLLEGAIVAFTGAVVGLVTGGLICWLQQTYGWVSMGMSTSVVEAYPVLMRPLDFAFTAAAIIFITFLVSIKPAQRAAALSIRENL
ncbi:releasing system transmembrane protein [Rufibacter radiotolerans]|uniref:Releasing system transmembrane protein n=1 Tax=Rufibacter radiotolerans TaxID=1379910 RepID=A0A0H4VMJ7_9BACT|nr:FtsX-like permease family protein [Rufibacter radiotolerans]AKQ47095.1 releasing system transmembrane protein [Rufibacter radiotolerans]